MSFDSHFYILVDNDSSAGLSSGDFEAIGTGTVVADFGPAQTISGAFGDFAGIDTGDQATMVGGTVAMTNGVLAATQPNDFTADVQGRLTAGAESYVIDDQVYGKFVATPIIGFLASGDGAGVLVNDSYYRTGAVLISGEN